MPSRQRQRRPRSSGAHEDAGITCALMLLADADDVDDQLLAVLLLEAAVKARQKNKKKSARRGPYDSVRVTQMFQALLEGFSDKFFQRWMRMTRQSFWYLHNLIKDDPVFQSTGNKPQLPVQYQLATFLIKWGEYGGVKTASVIGISEGSVYNYSRRVTTAILRISEQHLWWPSAERRNHIKQCMEEVYFPGCIGIVDGSLLKLEEKPWDCENPYAFYSRKQFYALAVQATCDHRARFTSYELGWPGSVTDTTIFQSSPLWQQVTQYFADDEYILADKGYPISPYTIRPFSEPELAAMPTEERQRQRKWNVALSAVRIVVEHAFCMLKGRFPILRSIPGNKLSEIYNSIRALMVIHNILISQGDDPADIEGFSGNEDLFVQEEHALRNNADDYQQDEQLAIPQLGRNTRGQQVSRGALSILGKARRMNLIAFWEENRI